MILWGKGILYLRAAFTHFVSVSTFSAVAVIDATCEYTCESEAVRENTKRTTPLCQI